jgi:maleate cis-trans isomerase
VVEAVPEMERTHGKPVITSNLAGAWSALRALGIRESLSHQGSLFSDWAV